MAADAIAEVVASRVESHDSDFLRWQIKNASERWPAEPPRPPPIFVENRGDSPEILAAIAARFARTAPCAIVSRRVRSLQSALEWLGVSSPPIPEPPRRRVFPPVSGRTAYVCSPDDIASLRTVVLSAVVVDEAHKHHPWLYDNVPAVPTPVSVWCRHILDANSVVLLSDAPPLEAAGWIRPESVEKRGTATLPEFDFGFDVHSMCGAVSGYDDDVGMFAAFDYAARPPRSPPSPIQEMQQPWDDMLG